VTYLRFFTMSDARDTNRDGHVSLMEKVKDKLHLGSKDKDAEYTTTHHTTTTATHQSAHGAIGTSSTTTHSTTTGALDSRDLNRDGHVSSYEKIESRTGALDSRAGALDSRDLNRDGHVSTTEKLAAGSAASSLASRDFNGSLASRDLNHDGHVSTTEKLATSGRSADLNRDGHISSSERLASGFNHNEKLASGYNHNGSEEARLKLHEEQLAVSKREVGAGGVDIHKRVQEEHVQQTIPVRREEVTVERRPLTGAALPGATIAAQDEVVRVPLFREEIVTEKRIVPTEEVVVRKQEVVDQQTVGATLRSEYVETMQTQQSGSVGAFDARDTNRGGHVSMGEKFKGDRALASGAYDARDTNRDGHVSMGEKLKGDSALASGTYDARDTNLDGHVSTGEKIKGAAAPASSFKAARG